jgi:hypothetical protein
MCVIVSSKQSREIEFSAFEGQEFTKHGHVVCHRNLQTEYADLEQGMRPSLWSNGQFLATNPEVPGLIPGATSFSEK